MSKITQLMNMKDRYVLVTGASGRLGFIISETLAELGANLILVDKYDDDLSKLKNKLSVFNNIKLTIIKCDLENESERNHLIKEVKKLNKDLNCLVNNAAFIGSNNLEGWATQLEDQSLDTWRRSMEVNLTAAFHLSKSFSNLLKKSKGGNIVNITSIYGELGPNWSLYENTNMANPAAYSISKGGLVQLTRWLATTLSPDIRVNAISPGGIFRDQPDNFVRRYESRTPLKRMANENDFRGVITYLASDMSEYVTGQVLRVDGGWGEW